MKDSFKAIACSLLGLFLALVLCWSALKHILDIDSFLLAILNYRVVGFWPSLVASRLIPAVMIVVAGMLVVKNGRNRMVGLMVTIGIFAVFSLAILSVLVRGLEVDCGCAIDNSQIGWASLLKPLVLAAVSAIGLSYELELRRK